jgi:hypothetical protein
VNKNWRDIPLPEPIAIDKFILDCVSDGDSFDDAAENLSKLEADKVQQIYDANPI